MNLPVHPPVLPMLSKRVAKLPVGPEWIYEPKWDGFRTLVFRDGDEIFIQSRDREVAESLFPGADRSASRTTSSAVRPRRRTRDRAQRRARFRCPAAAHSSGGITREIAQPADACLRRLLRPARGRHARLDEEAFQRTPQPGSKRYSPAPGLRFTSRRQPTILRARATGSAASKALVSTASWPNRSRASTNPTSAPCSRSSMSATATASSPAFAGIAKARSLPSAPCYWASMTRARCSTLESAAAFPCKSALSWSSISSPSAKMR